MLEKDIRCPVGNLLQNKLHSPPLKCRISGRLRRVLTAAAIFMMDWIHWGKTGNVQQRGFRK